MKYRLGWMAWAAVCVMSGHVLAADMTFAAAQTVSTNIVLSEDTTVCLFYGCGFGSR